MRGTIWNRIGNSILLATNCLNQRDRRRELATALSDVERSTAKGARVWLSPARAGFSARVHGRPDGVSGRKIGAGEKKPWERAGEGTTK
jgi:hypothetical protein